MSDDTTTDKAVDGADLPGPDEVQAPTDKPADSTEPPVPDEIREAARLAPDHWLGMVDPTWTGEGAPPSWALLGEWRSGPEGEITEWRANADYRPSPRALGWPEPTDPVDEAVQLAATGYGPGEAVPRALVTAEIAVLMAPGGKPVSATTPNEEAVVPAFTSPRHLHTSGRFGFELMPATDVLDLVPEGHLLYLNASGPVSMTVDIDAFRHAVRESAEEAGSSPGGEEGAVPSVPVRPSTVGGDVPGASVPAESAAEQGDEQPGEGDAAAGSRTAS